MRKSNFISHALACLLAVVGVSVVNGQTTAPRANQVPVVQPQAVTQPAMPGGATYFDSAAGCGTTSCTSGCTDSCLSDSGLFGRGIIKRSDHAFSDFISPMTNPVFFEDPRNNTEIRGIFFNHKVPLAAGGGDVQLYAAQIRARLSENVSLIATKDGYVTSSNPLINDGWADTAFGFKFNLIRDAATQTLLSTGFTYELPSGEADAFQGNGNGELNLFLSGGKQIGCKSHFLTAMGLRAPLNNTDESTSTYLSMHYDYKFRPRAYFLTELNWYHWLEAGRDGPIPGIEGLDVINFGNPGVAGNDIVTSAVGMKFKPHRHQEIGVAFEFPLTEREDILDNRLTVDWIFRF